MWTTAIKNALNTHAIYGAGLDTYKQEPLPSESPLYQVEDMDHLIMTGHMGWGVLSPATRSLKKYTSMWQPV
jgi:phosphoglycerate dehydrogenase-like enzyme